MRKIMYALFIFIISIGSVAYAAEPQEDNDDPIYGAYVCTVNKEIQDTLIQGVLNRILIEHEDFVWTSAQTKSGIQIGLYPQLGDKTYVGNCVSNLQREDLISLQVGQVVNSEEKDAVIEAFESNPQKAALFSIFPILSSEIKDIYNQMEVKEVMYKTEDVSYDAFILIVTIN